MIPKPVSGDYAQPYLFRLRSLLAAFRVSQSFCSRRSSSSSLPQVKPIL